MFSMFNLAVYTDSSSNRAGDGSEDGNSIFNREETGYESMYKYLVYYIKYL